MLGVVAISEPGLNLEAHRLVQLAGRISSCLLEFIINSRLEFSQQDGCQAVNWSSLSTVGLSLSSRTDIKLLVYYQQKVRVQLAGRISSCFLEFIINSRLEFSQQDGYQAVYWSSLSTVGQSLSSRRYIKLLVYYQQKVRVQLAGRISS